VAASVGHTGLLSALLERGLHPCNMAMVRTVMVNSALMMEAEMHAFCLKYLLKD
jgi:hypothetical protein